MQPSEYALVKTIFIAGTGTEVGKTTVTAALGYGCSEQGKRIGYWKPVSSGQPGDSETIAKHAPTVKIFPPCFSYATPVSPHAAAQQEKKAAVNLPTLEARLNDIQKSAALDLLLVEPAGGLLVPLNNEMQSWLDFLALRAELMILLVTHSGLGTLNHTALTLHCLQDSGFSVTAIVMCGERFHDNEATVRRMNRNIPVHSFTHCAKLSDDTEWPAHTQQLADFVSNSLDASDTAPAWYEHDRAIWHPFTSYRDDIHNREIVRASGVWLETADGHKMIDGIASWWTSSIGHGHESIARNCAAQIRKCDHIAFAGLTHEPAAQLAHTVIAMSGGHFARVFFSDNGSTAVEVAIKIAFQHQQNRGHPERDTFITLHGGYHGDTLGAMSLGDLDRFRSNFATLLFKTLRATPVTSHPSTLCPGGKQDLAKNLAALTQLVEANAPRICAMIVEPLVQGAAGMLVQDVEWLREVRKITAAHDIPLIFDEVFTGFSRSGHSFAFQRAEVVPDIICLAKGLTGGVLPLGLTLTQETFFRSFVEADAVFMHGHTFTANPVACRAALTALAFSQKNNLNERALHLENCFRAWIAQNRKHLTHPRTLGGILAFEVSDNQQAQAFAHHTATHGLFLRPLGNTIYCVPPLTIDEAELAFTFQALEKGLEQLA